MTTMIISWRVVLMTTSKTTKAIQLKRHDAMIQIVVPWVYPLVCRLDTSYTYRYIYIYTCILWSWPVKCIKMMSWFRLCMLVGGWGTGPGRLVPRTGGKPVPKLFVANPKRQKDFFRKLQHQFLSVFSFMMCEISSIQLPFKEFCLRK